MQLRQAEQHDAHAEHQHLPEHHWPMLLCSPTWFTAQTLGRTQGEGNKQEGQCGQEEMKIVLRYTSHLFQIHFP